MIKMSVAVRRIASCVSPKGSFNRRSSCGSLDGITHFYLDEGSHIPAKKERRASFSHSGQRRKDLLSYSHVNKRRVSLDPLSPTYQQSSLVIEQHHPHHSPINQNNRECSQFLSPAQDSPQQLQQHQKILSWSAPKGGSPSYLTQRRHTLHHPQTVSPIFAIRRRVSCGAIVLSPLEDCTSGRVGKPKQWNSCRLSPPYSTLDTEKKREFTRFSFDFPTNTYNHDGNLQEIRDEINDDSDKYQVVETEHMTNHDVETPPYIAVPKIVVHPAEHDSREGDSQAERESTVSTAALHFTSTVASHSQPAGSQFNLTNVCSKQNERRRYSLGPACHKPGLEQHLTTKLPRIPYHLSLKSHSHSPIETVSCSFLKDASLQSSQMSFKASNLSCIPPVGAVIGRGGFGIVKVGQYKGMNLAVKVLRGIRAVTSAEQEAHSLTLRPHAHLNTTHALVTPSDTPGYAHISWASYGRKTNVQREETVSRVARMFSMPLEDAKPACPTVAEGKSGHDRMAWAWVVSDLCTTATLLTLINDAQVEITAQNKARYLSELASGLAYMHSQGLAHLDVKPANALFTYHGSLRLTDYGCCTRLESSQQQVIGTVAYQAPEVLRGGSGYSCSDVFSLGVTAWHLLTRHPPYLGLHPHVIIYQVTQEQYRPCQHYHLDNESSLTFLEVLLYRLTKRCWAENPWDRPSAPDLCRYLTALSLSSAA